MPEPVHEQTTRVRPVRERVLDATATITAEHGWAAVTMGKVASLAGVSRQTVYNEYGAKPALGQAMVLRELERFLAVVAHELDTARRPGARDPGRGRADAADGARQPAAAHRCWPPRTASPRAARGADNELLPFLTTDAGPLIAAAKSVIVERLGTVPGPRAVDGESWTPPSTRSSGWCSAT